MNFLVATLKEQFISTVEKIWKVLTTKEALLIYAIIILLIVFVLVVRIMKNEQRRVDEINHRKKLKQDIINRETLNTIESTIEKKMDKINPGIVITGSNPTSITTSSNNASNNNNNKKKNNKKEAQEGESRFYMLTGIDKAYETYEAPEYDNEISLREICENFKRFVIRFAIYFIWQKIMKKSIY